ncbi:MAG: hypothetical protein Q8O55_08935 [Dehalococcoidales bacterium]|nr:hypothetical protein [Dehalococcoidales bacterium]
MKLIAVFFSILAILLWLAIEYSAAWGVSMKLSELLRKLAEN